MKKLSQPRIKICPISRTLVTNVVVHHPVENVQHCERNWEQDLKERSNRTSGFNKGINVAGDGKDDKEKVSQYFETIMERKRQELFEFKTKTST